MDCPPRAITWTPQWAPAVPPPRGVVHTCPTIRAAGTRCVWLAANSNDDGLQPRSSTATLCMRKADRSSTSHTTNSFWRVCGAQAAGDQRRVAVGGRMPEGRRRFGAWLRGGHNFPPLNLEAVCLVACYSYDGGPHWGADVRRPSLGSKDKTASQELVQSALRSSVAENLKGTWWLPTASVCAQ